MPDAPGLASETWEQASPRKHHTVCGSGNRVILSKAPGVALRAQGSALHSLNPALQPSGLILERV